MSEDIKSFETEKEALENLYTKNREVILQLVADGKLPEPRIMTRTERQALDKAGCNPLKTHTGDNRGFATVKEDLSDWIIENIYPDFDFSSVPNNICYYFGDYILALAYGSDLTIKN